MKKYIIFLLIIAVAGLTALTNWSEISYRAFISEADGEVDIITGATQNAEEQVDSSLKSGISWKHELSHQFRKDLSITLENNLLWSQKSQEYRNSYFYNFGKLDLKYNSGAHYVKVQYSNRFYDHNETRLLNIGGVDHRTQQQMVHNTSLQYKGKWNLFSAEFYAAVRSIDYEYYIEDLIDDKDDDDDEEEEEDIERYQSWENDLYSSGKLTYQLHDKWRVYTGIYYKNDLNEKNWYNENRVTLGVQYFNRFDFFNILKADLSYYKEDSQRLDQDQQNNFFTSIRFTKRIGSNLAGFISVQNHSCYDSTEKEILRISSLIRVRAKYSYSSSSVKDSYLQTGFKLNPENGGSIIFSEFNHNITGNFYTAVIGKHAPDTYSKLGGRIEYFFSSDKSIWIQDEYTDYVAWPSQHLISMGSTIIF